MLRKISELSKQIRGVSYKPSDIHANLNDSSIALLRANNISDGIINFDDVVYVDKSKVSDSQILRKGDILICASSGSKNLVGKAASVDFDGNYTFGAFLKVVRPNSEYSSYLGQFFQSPKYRKAISSLALGANINNIRNEHIDSLTVPEFDSKKREGIAARLLLISDVIKKRKFQMRALDDLVKARFVEMFGDGFETIELRNICKTTSGGTPSTKNPDYYNGTIPWVTTTALGPNHIDGTKAKAYISEEAVANSATKIIPSGSILFGIRVGVGKTSINDVDICTNQDIVAIMDVNETKFSKLFIKHVLDANRAHYDSLKKGATILGITSDDLKNTPIPLAPIKAQKDFETFVEQVDKSKFNALKPRHKPYEFSQIMV